MNQHFRSMKMRTNSEAYTAQKGLNYIDEMEHGKLIKKQKRIYKESSPDSLVFKPKIMGLSKRQSKSPKKVNEWSIQKVNQRNIKTCQQKSENKSVSQKRRKKWNISFFDYCNQQIFQMAQQNRQLQKTQLQIDRQALKKQQQKQKLKKKIQLKKHILQKHQQIYNKQNREIMKLQKQLQGYKLLINIQSQVKSDDSSQNKSKMIQFQQKHQRNLSIKSKIRQLADKNHSLCHLNNQKNSKTKIIVNLLKECQKLQSNNSQQMNNLDTVSHLWEVKQIQYDNLLRLIANQ